MLPFATVEVFGSRAPDAKAFDDVFHRFLIARVLFATAAIEVVARLRLAKHANKVAGFKLAKGEQRTGGTQRAFGVAPNQAGTDRAEPAIGGE